jgi:uncharacterized protein (DUF362 family)
VNANGSAVLEEEKADDTNMINMKHGDEDLVEDEGSTAINARNKTNYDTSDIKEDYLISESTNEQKVTGNIPMLKNNKNALIRNSKPFSRFSNRKD